MRVVVHPLQVLRQPEPLPRYEDDEEEEEEEPTFGKQLKGAELEGKYYHPEAAPAQDVTFRLDAEGDDELTAVREQLEKWLPTGGYRLVERHKVYTPFHYGGFRQRLVFSRVMPR